MMNQGKQKRNKMKLWCIVFRSFLIRWCIVAMQYRPDVYTKQFTHRRDRNRKNPPSNWALNSINGVKLFFVVILSEDKTNKCFFHREDSYESCWLLKQLGLRCTEISLVCACLCVCARAQRRWIFKDLCSITMKYKNSISEKAGFTESIYSDCAPILHSMHNLKTIYFQLFWASKTRLFMDVKYNQVIIKILLVLPFPAVQSQC